MWIWAMRQGLTTMAIMKANIVIYHVVLMGCVWGVFVACPLIDPDLTDVGVQISPLKRWETCAVR